MASRTEAEMKLEEACETRPTSSKSGVKDSPQVQQAEQETLTREENRRMLIKTNGVVLFIMIFASLLAFLDKNALGFAAVYGINEDTNLKNQDYSWLGSIFYFGYLVMQLPAAWLLTHARIGKMIGTLLLLWGIVICGIAGCKNFATLAVARFFLGVFEAALLPACILLTSIWYRREEQPIVSALYFNTLAGVFGGILAYAIGQIQGSLAPWKYLFIIYGAVTLFFGVVVLLGLPDSPAKAWFFTAHEKKLVVIRTAGNQTGTTTTNKSWKWKQVIEAIRDPKYWVLAVAITAFSITNAGLTNFNPLIISGYGFSRTKTTLMAAPQAAIAFVSQVAATVIMLYVPNVRCIIWAVSTLPALAGSVMIHTLDIENHRTASLMGVYLMGFYNISFVTLLSLKASNVSGTTKKSFASVSVAVWYSVGNIIGPQFFRTEESPYYPLGIHALMAAFAINCLMGISYFLLCVFENRRRDRVYGKVVDSTTAIGLEVEEEDQTDVENTNFRYTY